MNIFNFADRWRAINPRRNCALEQAEALLEQMRAAYATKNYALHSRLSCEHRELMQQYWSSVNDAPLALASWESREEYGVAYAE